MQTRAAVVGSEAHFDNLAVVGGHVEAHGGPVFPYVLFIRIFVPPQVPAGPEIGYTADWVDDLAVTIEHLHPEAGLG